MQSKERVVLESDPRITVYLMDLDNKKHLMLRA